MLHLQRKTRTWQQRLRRLTLKTPKELLRKLRPRTFQRFTRRSGGYVGGPARTVGWHNYKQLGPKQVLPGLWMVGDSVFPGQSTLATALGGARTARAIHKKLEKR